MSWPQLQPPKSQRMRSHTAASRPAGRCPARLPPTAPCPHASRHAQPHHPPPIAPRAHSCLPTAAQPACSRRVRRLRRRRAAHSSPSTNWRMTSGTPASSPGTSSMPASAGSATVCAVPANASTCDQALRGCKFRVECSAALGCVPSDVPLGGRHSSLSSVPTCGRAPSLRPLTVHCEGSQPAMCKCPVEHEPAKQWMRLVGAPAGVRGCPSCRGTAGARSAGASCPPTSRCRSAPRSSPPVCSSRAQCPG
jgi:hypothetical protein